MGRRKLFTREDVLDKAIPSLLESMASLRRSVQDLEQATGVRKSGLYTENSRTKKTCSWRSLRRVFRRPEWHADHLTKQPLGWINVESFLKGLLWELGAERLLLIKFYARVRRPPPKARQIMVASVMKAHQLLIDNLAAARARDLVTIMILSLA